MHNSLLNHLLAALPTDEYQRLSPHLELVSLPRGCALYEAHVRIRHAYFPTTAIVSMVYDMASGGSTEIAVIGNDGVVGVPLIMGGDATTSRAIVQSAGYAFRLDRQVLKDEFARAGQMQGLLLRYSQALLTQIAQTAVCNRYHSVGQQLCRWLLLNLDRSPSNELAMTHELMAHMLGVRREGITEAAGKLQQAGLIHYSRGKITVANRFGLEECACECYQAIKSECDRLLPKAIVQEPGSQEVSAPVFMVAHRSARNLKAPTLQIREVPDTAKEIGPFTGH